MEKKVLIREKMQNLIELTARFSDEYLDEDYKQLCEKLIRMMSRKHYVPYLSGRIEIWAAAIVYALGQINFLFDHESEPHISRDDISNYFGTSKSTVSQRSKLIRDMFKMTYWDENFSSKYVIENNFFSNLVMANGVIVDKQVFNPEIQKILNQTKHEKESFISKYKNYRKIGMELNQKIIDSCLSHEVVKDASNLLGISNKDHINLDNGIKTNILLDFALNDYKVNNKNAVEIYREKSGLQNKIEKEILEALISSHTSLFEIKNVLIREKIIFLNDVLKKRDNIRLIDISLSQAVYPGLLLFTRLVSLKEFNMTSGVNFIFPNGLERYLVDEYKTLSSDVKPEDIPKNRYITFFKLYKEILFE
ncbi:MAG: DUF6398 domain-containing protein [Promethearchaeota archaeon]